MGSYSEKLRDPRWQKKRLEILQRHDFKCAECLDDKSPLHVHHLRYIRGADPWETPAGALVALCENCHEAIHAYGGPSIPESFLCAWYARGGSWDDLTGLWVELDIAIPRGIRLSREQWNAAVARFGEALREVTGEYPDA